MPSRLTSQEARKITAITIASFIKVNRRHERPILTQIRYSSAEALMQQEVQDKSKTI
jgi:hypothetical protein